MPTRRIFLMTVMVVVLAWPAEQVIRQWGRRQLAVHQEGEIMHAVGEVLVTVLP